MVDFLTRKVQAPTAGCSLAAGLLIVFLLGEILAAYYYYYNNK